MEKGTTVAVQQKALQRRGQLSTFKSCLLSRVEELGGGPGGMAKEMRVQVRTGGLGGAVGMSNRMRKRWVRESLYLTDSAYAGEVSVVSSTGGEGWMSVKKRENTKSQGSCQNLTILISKMSTSMPAKVYLKKHDALFLPKCAVS